MGEIDPFEKQRFSRRYRKCIRETVAEIQLGRMPAALAEITICFTRKSHLSFPEEVVETPAGDRLPTPVNDDRGFQKVRRRYAQSPRNCFQLRAIIFFGISKLWHLPPFYLDSEVKNSDFS